jgi:chromate transporter
VNDGRPEAVSLLKIFWVFLYIGATSFGGGVVAYLRSHLVDSQEWLDDDQFLASLEIAETVPGLISTNVAVIVGNRLAGAAGAIVAVVGTVIPGAIAIFLLGLIYAHFKSNPDVAAGLHGVSAAAVGLILAVTLQIGHRELKLGSDMAILAAAFVLVGVLHISLVPVLVVLAPIAIWVNRPTQSELAKYHTQQAALHTELAARHGAIATNPAHTGSES